LIERTSGKAQPAHLLVKSQKGFVNEPLLLGVSIENASGGETVMLTGMAVGTKISAGTPVSLMAWRVMAHDLANAAVYAPKDFVGVMDAAIKLRSAHARLLESRVIRLEWTQKNVEALVRQIDPFKPPPALQRLDSEQGAFVENFLKHGDFASVRLLLKRAANAGNAQAAFALGATFDPVFLSEEGFVGFTPDVAQAYTWYKRAAELGSTEASRRLERLAPGGPGTLKEFDWD
jgi:TPR repeat protein